MEKGASAERIRTVFASDEFKQFYDNSEERIQQKLDQLIYIIEWIYVLQTKFVKKLIGVNLYEMRISVGYNGYRTILFAVDHENIIQSTEVILLNSFFEEVKQGL